VPHHPPLNDTRTYLPTFDCSAIISLEYLPARVIIAVLTSALKPWCYLWTVVMASRSRSPSPIANLSDVPRCSGQPRQIANRIARGRQRLGYYTVLCFLDNRIVRIVGTGIFVSPGAVISGTQSVGFISLLLILALWCHQFLCCFISLFY
jgi:hypothetical protein